MRFGSVCSGIEAASVAWEPLGWQAAWLAEIEPFPAAVLKYHYANVPNLGDMTRLPEMIRAGEVEAPDLFCGGTPCQAFSVAGLRKSLDDARGNLSLTFCEIANAIDTQRAGSAQPPAIIFWENVPGVLSTKDNAFGCFLAGLAGEENPVEPPRGKWTNAGVVLGPQRAVAWRILDAQYFGLAQRRRRVFVVASARDDFDPVSVLLEFDGVRRDSAPSREAGKVASTLTAPRSGGGGSYRLDAHDVDGGFVQPVGPGVEQAYEVGNTLTARMYKGINTTCDDGQTPVITVTHSLRGEGFDASEDGTGRGTPLVPVAMRSDVTPKWQDDLAFTLTQPSPTGGGQPQAVFDPIAFDTTQITSPENGSNPKPGGPCHPLAAGAHAPAVAYSMRADHGVAQPVAFHPTQDPISSTDGTTHAMGCGSSGGQASVAVAFSSKDYGADATTELAPTLRAMNHAESHANGGGQMAVAFTETAQTLTAGYEFDYNDEKKAASHLVSSTNVCHSIGANENATAVVAIQDVRAMNKAQNGRGWNDDGSSYTVDTHATQSVAVAVGADCFNGSLTGDVGATMGTRGSSQNASGPTVMQAMQVRRLTPVECERLQGFPDDYTAIPWRNKPASECPDGPRYKALGNSWAVPVVRWIGRRIHNALVGGAA